MIAGVAIDTWKLKIFKRRLDASGFAYTQLRGPAGTLILRVKTESAAVLLPVVKAAQLECAERAGP